VVPDWVTECSFLAAVDVEGLAFDCEVKASVVVLCKEIVVPVLDSVPEVVAVPMAASTAKPCC